MAPVLQTTVCVLVSDWPHSIILDITICSLWWLSQKKINILHINMEVYGESVDV